MERKGIFTPEQEDFIVNALKEVIKVNNPFFNMFKGFALKMIVKGADDIGLDKIEPSWKEKLIPIVDAAMNKEYEKVRQLVVDLLNEKIDFKGLDAEQQLMLFDGLTRFLAAAIDYFVQKKLAA